MTERRVDTVSKKRFDFTQIVLLIIPLLLLAGVIALFLSTGGGLRLTQPAPVEALTVERTILAPGSIELVVRNGGPEPVEIAQVIINDAVWPARVEPAGPIPRLQHATVHLDYMWTTGEAYGITLFTTNAIAFDAEIPVAFTTPQPGARDMLSFTLIGLYVGVIPVFLGIFWFPALRRLEQRWMIFLLAVTAGLLAFLGIDTLAEALEQSGRVPGPFQGIGLVGVGAVGTFLLLEAISRLETRGKSPEDRRASLAWRIALGIGLHNLGEGLAIGAAYSVGEVALGSFLVVGFIIQNITEGLGIIAPLLRDRPGWGKLALLGILGGAPAIFGAWIGAFTPSPTLAVLFLGIGAGAIFEVILEIGRLIRKDEPMPLTVFSGALAGMLLLWVTGLLIK